MLLDQVVESRRNLIRLCCTQDELAEMEPFLEICYVDARATDYSGLHFGADPYAFEARYASHTPEAIQGAGERIPPGELAFHCCPAVEATDGQIGSVGEFLIGPETGQITHLVLKEGHLWGKQEVAPPVAAIDHVEADTVCLKLDKRDIEGLPAIPATRHYARGEA